MIKSLLYMAPIVFIGVVATEASAAAPAAWSGSMGRNITATVPEGQACRRSSCARGGAEAAAVLAAVAVLAPVVAAVIAAVGVAAVPGPVPAEATSVALTRTAATSAAPM